MSTSRQTDRAAMLRLVVDPSTSGALSVLPVTRLVDMGRDHASAAGV